MLNRSANLAMSTRVLKALLVNLISKDTKLIFSMHIKLKVNEYDDTEEEMQNNNRHMTARTELM